MTVFTATDGREALCTLINLDLILMDMMMQEMDGYETLGLIRLNENHKDFRLLLLPQKRWWAMQRKLKY